MSARITDEKRAEVLRLLDEGVTYRRIHTLTGIARGTIANIKFGSTASPADVRRRKARLTPLGVGEWYHCEKHKTMTRGGCVACAAEAYRERQRAAKLRVAE
jgi:hypothetical protein